MIPSDLIAAAQAHAREGRIDYAVHVARCEMCQATTTWMGAPFIVHPYSVDYHACDTGAWGSSCDMPYGRRGKSAPVGHYRLTEEQFEECRQLAAARKPSP